MSSFQKTPYSLNCEKKRPSEVNLHFMAHLSSLSSCDLEIEIHADAEADEFWSYVGNKKNQRWTWYAIERKSGIIMADEPMRAAAA